MLQRSKENISPELSTVGDDLSDLLLEASERKFERLLGYDFSQTLSGVIVNLNELSQVLLPLSIELFFFSAAVNFFFIFFDP